MAKVSVEIDVEPNETLGAALLRTAKQEPSPEMFADLVAAFCLKGDSDPWHAVAKAFGDALQAISERAGHNFVPTRVTFKFERGREPYYQMERLDIGRPPASVIRG